MLLNKIKMAIYALFLTNLYGFRLKKIVSNKEKKRVRLNYAKQLLQKLNIEIYVKNQDKLEKNGQYLLVSNHRSIIDPLIVEMALKETNIYGLWVAKKELYNSFFFGTFTRNAGSVLLDREAKQMSSFFKSLKTIVSNKDSIFIFPEGTRNKEETDLSDFKDGVRIIALKNRLPILPVYIRSNANKILKEAIHDRSKTLKIEIEIGDLIDYKDKKGVEGAYREIFGLEQRVCLDK